MLVTFLCTHCGAELETDAKDAGVLVQCAGCGQTMTAPKKGVEAGTTVGGFLIKKLIAAGGMGKVFLARQLSMDRDVALKVLPPQFAVDPEDAARFLNEVRATARLDHPNIVAAYEAGEDDGVSYLAMAYIEGEPLDSRIKRTGPVPEPQALQLIRKIVSALAYAWNRHQMLHRDVKPENILVDERGEPRLTDFGLAKTFQGPAVVTLAGTVIGTPNYMSPEQMDDLSTVDFRSDMYSLGCTLYHMLTGQVPFHGDTLTSTFQKVAMQSLPDPRAVRPHISEGCVLLLHKLLAKTPPLRHSTWEALMEDLERVQQGGRPSPPLPAADQSVLRLQEHGRAASAHHHAGPAHHVAVHAAHSHPPAVAAPTIVEPKKSGMAVGVGAAAAVVVVIAIIAAAIAQRTQTPPVDATPAVPDTTVAAAADQRLALEQQLDAATRYVKEHPEDYEGGSQRLQAVASVAKGTEVQNLVAAAVERFAAGRDAAAKKARDALTGKVEQACSAGQWDEALAVLRTYSGPLAGDLAADRKSLEESVTRRAQAARDALTQKTVADNAAGEAALTAFVDGVADDFMRADFDAARRRLADADTNTALKARAEEWTAVRTMATEVVRMPEVLLQTFRDDVGRNAKVAFKTGVVALRITGVSGDSITGEVRWENGAALGRTFKLADLSYREQCTRLGRSETPARDIMRGLAAVEAEEFATAGKCFAQAPCPIAIRLAALASQQSHAEQTDLAARQNTAADAVAEKAYREILDCLHFTPDDTDVQATADKLGETRFGALTVKRGQEMLKGFRAKYGETEFAKSHTAVLDMIENLKAGVMSRFSPDTIRKAVAQVRLDNPGMTNSPRLQVDGKLVSLSFMGDTGVQDISALQGLPLCALDLNGSRIDSIKVLKGMPLTSLRIGNCQFLKDFSPLKGMSLTALDLEHTPIPDLTCLKGLPLTDLSISRCTDIADLDALRDMPLTRLDAHGLWRVADLSPLRGKKLTWLSLSGLRKVTDLKALEGMPLTYLDLGGTGVTDLTPLRGMPLTHLHAHGLAADFSAVKSMRTLTDLER